MGNRDREKEQSDSKSLTRRRLLATGSSAALGISSGLAARAAQDFSEFDRDTPSTLPDYDNPDIDRPPTDFSGLQTPRRKPVQSGADISARWTRLADMPMPVQEIYPAPFWTRDVSLTQTRKSVQTQRYNILVNAGGITGVRDGLVTATDRVFTYEPISDRWTEVSHLPEACHHLHLVPHNDSLYAIGGFTTARYRREPANYGWRMRTDVHRIDNLNRRWQSMTPLPSPQAEAVCVSLNGIIHIVGGRAPIGSQNSRWTDHLDTDRHLAFDERSNSWVDLAPMSEPRNSAAGVAIRGVIYMFGGRKVNGRNLNISEAYDPLADRWQLMRPMPVAQAGLAAAALGSTIFVFGGEYFENGGGVYSRVWAYDTREDRWHDAGTMPTPKHGLGAVAMNNAIYVMGGATSPGGTGTSSGLERLLR